MLCSDLPILLILTYVYSSESLLQTLDTTQSLFHSSRVPPSTTSVIKPYVHLDLLTTLPSRFYQVDLKILHHRTSLIQQTLVTKPISYTVSDYIYGKWVDPVFVWTIRVYNPKVLLLSLPSPLLLFAGPQVQNSFIPFYRTYIYHNFSLTLCVCLYLSNKLVCN